MSPTPCLRLVLLALIAATIFSIDIEEERFCYRNVVFSSIVNFTQNETSEVRSRPWYFFGLVERKITTKVEIVKNSSINSTVIEISCCPGWKEMARNCSTPICDQACVHGDCVRPNVCSCIANYTGPSCNTSSTSEGCEKGSCPDLELDIDSNRSREGVISEVHGRRGVWETSSVSLVVTGAICSLVLIIMLAMLAALIWHRRRSRCLSWSQRVSTFIDVAGKSYSDHITEDSTLSPSPPVGETNVTPSPPVSDSAAVAPAPLIGSRSPPEKHPSSLQDASSTVFSRAGSRTSPQMRKVSALPIYQGSICSQTALLCRSSSSMRDLHSSSSPSARLDPERLVSGSDPAVYPPRPRLDTAYSLLDQDWEDSFKASPFYDKLSVGNSDQSNRNNVENVTLSSSQTSGSSTSSRASRGRRDETGHVESLKQSARNIARDPIAMENSTQRPSISSKHPYDEVYIDLDVSDKKESTQKPSSG